MRQPSKLTETISAAVAIRLLLLFSGVKVINTISIHPHSTDALSVDKVILIQIKFSLPTYKDLCITKRGESVVKYFGLHGCKDHEILQGSRNLGMHLSK